jgi:hypothetical protein
MADLTDVARLAAGDHHLAVFTVARSEGSVHASVVNAGVMDDPVDGSAGVAAVIRGGTRKLALLRTEGRATLVFKVGGDWAAVAGPVRLVGPDDGADLALDVPALIRSVFAAAGGTHTGTGPSSTASWRRTGAAPSSSGPTPSRPIRPRADAPRTVRAPVGWARPAPAIPRFDLRADPTRGVTT